MQCHSSMKAIFSFILSTGFLIANANTVFANSSLAGDCVLYAQRGVSEKNKTELRNKNYRLIEAEIKFSQQGISFGLAPNAKMSVKQTFDAIPTHAMLVVEKSASLWDPGSWLSQSGWLIAYKSPEVMNRLLTFEAKQLSLNGEGRTEQALNQMPHCREILRYRDNLRASGGLFAVVDRMIQLIDAHDSRNAQTGWSESILRFENLLLEPSFSVALDRARFHDSLFQEKIKNLKTVLANQQNKKDAVKIFRKSVLNSFPVRNYILTFPHMRNYFSADPGGNCVAQTLLLVAVAKELGLQIPEPWVLGVQEFADHLRPVLVDPSSNRVFDLVYGHMDNEISGPIFKPEILLVRALAAIQLKYPQMTLRASRFLNDDYAFSLLITQGKMPSSAVKSQLAENKSQSSSIYEKAFLVKRAVRFSQRNPPARSQLGLETETDLVQKGTPHDPRKDPFNSLRPGGNSGSLGFGDGALNLLKQKDAEHLRQALEDSFALVNAQEQKIYKSILDKKTAMNERDVQIFTQQLFPATYKADQKRRLKPRIVLAEKLPMNVSFLPLHSIGSRVDEPMKPYEEIVFRFADAFDFSLFVPDVRNGLGRNRDVIFVKDQALKEKLTAIPTEQFYDYIFLKRNEMLMDLHKYLNISKFYASLADPKLMLAKSESTLTNWTQTLQIIAALTAQSYDQNEFDPTQWCQLANETKQTKIIPLELLQNLKSSFLLGSKNLGTHAGEFVKAFGALTDSKQLALLNIFKSLSILQYYAGLDPLTLREDSALRNQIIKCLGNDALFSFKYQSVASSPFMDQLYLFRSMFLNIMTDPEVLYTTQDPSVIEQLRFAHYAGLKPLQSGPDLNSNPTGEVPISASNPSEKNKSFANKMPVIESLEILTEAEYQKIVQQGPQRQSQRLLKLKQRPIEKIKDKTFAYLLLLLDKNFLRHQLVSLFVSANTTEKVALEWSKIKFRSKLDTNDGSSDIVLSAMVDEKVAAGQGMMGGANAAYSRVSLTTSLDATGGSGFGEIFDPTIFGISWLNLPAAAFLAETPRSSKAMSCLLYYQNKIDMGFAATSSEAQQALYSGVGFMAAASMALVNNQAGSHSANATATVAPDWLRKNDHLVFYWELIRNLGTTVAPSKIFFGYGQFAGDLIMYPAWLTKRLAVRAPNGLRLIDEAGFQKIFWKINSSDSVLLELTEGGWFSAKQLQSDNAALIFELDDGKFLSNTYERSADGQKAFLQWPAKVIYNSRGMNLPRSFFMSLKDPKSKFEDTCL